MRMTHTQFTKGAKIRVIEKDGTVTIAKFIMKVGKKMIRTDKGDFRVIDIRSANYYKPLPHEMNK